jgi:hypothetical protein
VKLQLRDGSGDGVADGLPSSKQRIDARGLDSVDRRRERRMLWRLSFCKNYRRMARLFIGVLTPTRRGLGILTNLPRNRLQITSDKEKSERG